MPENEEPVGEGHYILARINNSEEVCKIETVLPSSEEAIVYCFRRVDKNIYEHSKTIVIKNDDVVKQVPSPLVVGDEPNLRYLFPYLP